jgi:hypothetical protein
MFKFLLWVGAVVFGYLAYKSGDMRVDTGDLAYLKQAIFWGIAALVCLAFAVRTGSKTKQKAKAGAGSSR